MLLPKDLKITFQKAMLDEKKSMAEVIRDFMIDYLTKRGYYGKSRKTA